MTHPRGRVKDLVSLLNLVVLSVPHVRACTPEDLRIVFSGVGIPEDVGLAYGAVYQDIEPG